LKFWQDTKKNTQDDEQKLTKKGEKSPKKSPKKKQPVVQWVNETQIGEMAVSKGMKKCFEMMKQEESPKKKIKRKNKLRKKEDGNNLKIDDMFQKVATKKQKE